MCARARAHISIYTIDIDWFDRNSYCLAKFIAKFFLSFGWFLIKRASSWYRLLSAEQTKPLDARERKKRDLNIHLLSSYTRFIFINAHDEFPSFGKFYITISFNQKTFLNSIKQITKMLNKFARKKNETFFPACFKR